MTKNHFMANLKELKRSKPISDHRLELFYKGVNFGCIYGAHCWGESHLDEIEVDDRQTYVLVYTDTFGLCVDDAEVESI